MLELGFLLIYPVFVFLFRHTFLITLSASQPDYDDIDLETRIKLSRGKSDKGKDNKKYGKLLFNTLIGELF